MIYKKQYGQPFDTESVVGSFLPMMETIPYLTKEPDGFSYAMEPQDVLYGLGENVRGINKRGWVYESKCSDDGNHTEGKSSLYGAYNFMIVSGKDTFGFFIDYPGKVTFDCGYTDLDTLRITVAEENYDLYIIEGESLTDIVHQFRQLVGRSYIPPKWAFGNAQSRWSYMNEDEVREVVANYRANHMPLDAVVLDIDYMERYKDFTVDAQRFPHFADFAAEMKAQGIRLVPIIDAGVKVEEGYDVYEEGVKKGYFCTNQDGTPFVAGVWPGRVHFPDMLNPEARAWFGSQYKVLLDQGIEGFWNDMNEPASFDGELPPDVEFTDEARPVTHAEAHNFYGHNMSKATYEGLKALTGKRPFVITRACYAGTQKYSTVWTGDNQSLWAHLQMAIPQLCNLGLSGIAFAGTDVGGFGCNTTPELLTRWTQVGAFSPLFRNHSSLGTLRQEPYVFGDPYMSICREYIALRYSLLPYFYDCFKTCEETGLPVMRPLVLQYENDENVRDMNDQFMIGDDILVSPVVTQGATKKLVYLPAGDWFDFHTGEKLAGGRYIVKDAPLSVCPIFVRDGAILPRFAPQQFVGEVDNNKTLYLTVYGDNGSYVHYQDNGTDFAYRDGAYNTYEIVNKNGKVETTLLHAGFEKVYENIEIETVR